MLRIIAMAAGISLALSGGAGAETYEVQMLNKGDAGRMIFEPDLLKLEVGDKVKFIAASKSHNAETIDGMLPDGAAAFKGKINEEIEYEFQTEGLYGIKCKPHYAMGMVMTIAVGDDVVVPQGFLEGRIPKKAQKRFETQLSGL